MYKRLREGQFFYPALSTVDQSYREIGYKACELIYGELNGNTGIARETVPSRFACGLSCGCKGNRDYDQMRIEYCRQSFKRNINAKLLEQNERIIRQWMADMPDYNAIKETLRRH